MEEYPISSNESSQQSVVERQGMVGDGASEESSQESLIRHVYDIVGNPIDAWQVAATLESLGWRDVDARDQFKKEDVFDLAKDIEQRIRQIESEKLIPRPTKPARRNRARTLERVLRYYGKGAMSALPIVGQIAAILVLRYSLWAWVDFTEAQATVVALGTLLSFVVTGGFIQGISREGIRYIGGQNYLLAEQVCWKLVGYGTIAVLLVGVGIFVLNLIIPFYDLKLVLVSLTYYVLLSELWLYSSVAYVLNRTFMIFLVMTAGVVPVFYIMELTSLGIYIAHWSGLVFALVALMVYTISDFRSLAAMTAADLKLGRLPRPSVRAYLVAPYFVYGFFYFLNLFLDRIVSWSAPHPEIPPYVIWFRTPYELGMDWALISLILTLAVMEFFIQDFSYFQLPVQKAVKFVDLRRYTRFFKNLHDRFFIVLLCVGLLDIVVTYFGVLYFRQFSGIQEIRDFFASPITFITFYGAAAGYFFIALGLYNSLFFFTLSRPEFVLKSIIPATAVNLFVGLAASRWIDYEYGVIGLVAGGLTFAFLSWQYARRFFRQLDYYYYSAF